MTAVIGERDSDQLDDRVANSQPARSAELQAAALGQPLDHSAWMRPPRVRSIRIRARAASPGCRRWCVA
jgi:hypothetical protein